MKLFEPISSAASHRTVIARIGGGSQSDLASFFDTTSPLVFALVVRMVGDNAAAEAILAEVYRQVWNQAARYNSGSEQPLTWLFRLARQEALVHLQTNGRVPAQMGMAVAVGARNGAGGAAQPQHVRLALGLLPAEQLQVIEMAYFGGLNYH